MLVAKQRGMNEITTPEWMQAIYDRGNEHEPQCVAAMRELGYNVTREQEEVVISVGGAQIVGHIDGAIMDKSVVVPVGLEIKAPGAWTKFRDAHLRNDYSDPLAYRYAWQVSCYSAALGLEMLIACWDEDEGIQTFGIEVPPFNLEDIEDRVGSLEGYITLDKLPTTCDRPFSFCPFPYLHDDQPEVTEDELLDLHAAAYLAAAEREKIAAAEKKMVYDLLLAHGGGVTALHKVSVYEQKGRSYLDETQMDRDGIDLAKYRRTGNPSQRVKITKRGVDPFTE
jgi:hypothetical protein